MTFRKVLCPHCRGKLETGQRIHPRCIDGYTDAQQTKKERADARPPHGCEGERASIKARKEAIKTLADLKREADRLNPVDCARPSPNLYFLHRTASGPFNTYKGRGIHLNPLNVHRQNAPNKRKPDLLGH